MPINALVSKVEKLGKKPLSVGGGFGVFIVSPDGGPDWKMRTVVTLLFPG